MKILMVNKFLYPNGGSETYIFKLGNYLKNQGHEVQYFGMEHESRCVSNHVNAYTADMDFHNGHKISKLAYPIKTVYSFEARKKIRLVLDDFQPDVVHLNNFNYQLTPSIIIETRKWERESGHSVRLVFTAHDYQLLCPNHMLHNPNTHRNCEKCINGKFINCIKGRCIHGSVIKSAVGVIEAVYWQIRKIYCQIDMIICPSEFMKKMMDANPLFKEKTVVIYNFIDSISDLPSIATEKIEIDGKYILYFGRYSEEKGILTLLEVCKRLPHIQFVFAGKGPLKESLTELPNVKDVGFCTDDRMKSLIKNAEFSLCPSECYEVFGLAIGESMQNGTPVVASKIGAIPELISDNVDGMLLTSGDIEQWVHCIRTLWSEPEHLRRLKEQCKKKCFLSSNNYGLELIKVYTG